MIQDILTIIYIIASIILLWHKNQVIDKLKNYSQLDKNDIEELQSKIDFWKSRCEEFNLDKAILHERNLRKRFETLYHKACDELDKLKDKRQFNGTKHKQRNERTNNNGKTN